MSQVGLLELLQSCWKWEIFGIFWNWERWEAQEYLSFSAPLGMGNLWEFFGIERGEKHRDICPSVPPWEWEFMGIFWNCERWEAQGYLSFSAPLEPNPGMEKNSLARPHRAFPAGFSPFPKERDANFLIEISWVSGRFFLLLKKKNTSMN